MRADEDGNVYVRQSFLDTLLSNCAEQARLDLVHPERLTESDAANAGVGTHAAVEAFLNGEISLKELPAYAWHAAHELCSTLDIKYVKFDGWQELCARSEAAAAAWVRDIAPLVPMGGEAEVKFCVPLYVEKFLDGVTLPRTIFIEGTIDYIPGDGTVWDWKFPGREYKQHDKQDHAIQPTVYTTAAHLLYGYEWPIKFNYGIGQHHKTNRDGVTAKGYVFPVMRYEGHMHFLERTIRSALALYDALGLDQPWPLTGEFGFLCSEKWCDHWSQCRGALLTQQQVQWRP